MNKFYPILIFTFCFILNINILSAQDEDWVKVKFIEGVTVEYKIDQCGDSPAIFIKATSVRNDTRYLSWEEVIYAQPHGGNSADIVKKVNQRKMAVPPKVITIGYCNQSTDAGFLILGSEEFPDLNMKNHDIVDFLIKRIQLTYN